VYSVVVLIKIFLPTVNLHKGGCAPGEIVFTRVEYFSETIPPGSDALWASSPKISRGKHGAPSQNVPANFLMGYVYSIGSLKGLSVDIKESRLPLSNSCVRNEGGF
jgi:hypothetical protein